MTRKGKKASHPEEPDTERTLKDEVQASEEEKPQDETAALRGRIEELEALAEALRNEAARAKADLYNFRQRVDRDRARMRQTLLEELALRLLPVVDNLDRALTSREGVAVKDLRDGVSMVQRQFLQTLAGFGIVPIDAVGSSFDPAFHEAVALYETTEEEKEGRVICEILKGYCLDDRVIRPAQVQVGKKVDSDDTK